MSSQPYSPEYLLGIISEGEERTPRAQQNYSEDELLKIINESPSKNEAKNISRAGPPPTIPSSVLSGAVSGLVGAIPPVLANDMANFGYELSTDKFKRRIASGEMPSNPLALIGDLIGSYDALNGKPEWLKSSDSWLKKLFPSFVSREDVADSPLGYARAAGEGLGFGSALKAAARAAPSLVSKEAGDLLTNAGISVGAEAGSRNTDQSTLGTLAGGVGGALLGGGAKSLISGANSSYNPLSSKRVSERTAKAADKLLADALEKDGIDPAEYLDYAKKVQESSSAPLKPIEIINKFREERLGAPAENTKALLGISAKVPNDLSSKVADVAASRSNQQPERISNLFDETLSKTNYAQALKEIKGNVDTYANEARDRALSSPVSFSLSDKSPNGYTLRELLNPQKDVIKNVIKETEQMLRNRGDFAGAEKIKGFINGSSEINPITMARRPVQLDTESLWNLRKGIDEFILSEKSKNPIAAISSKTPLTSAGKDAVALRKEINDIIKNKNPDYKEWMRVFSDEAAKTEALEAGRKFLRKTSNDAIKSYQLLDSDAERHHFLIGVKDALLERASSVGTPQKKELSSALWSKGIEKRLKAILPKEDFQKISSTLADEQRMAISDKEIKGSVKSAFASNAAEKIGGDAAKTPLQAILDARASLENSLSPLSVITGGKYAVGRAGQRGLEQFFRNRENLAAKIRSESILNKLYLDENAINTYLERGGKSAPYLSRRASGSSGLTDSLTREAKNSLKTLQDPRLMLYLNQIQ